MTHNLRSLVIAGIGLCILAAASTPPAGDDAAATGENGVSDSEAIPAEALGGMHVAVKVGRDGELYAFVLSPDRADGEIIKTFSEDDLKVNSAQSDGASQYDINATHRLKSTGRAPEVFDLGQAVALTNENMSAPDQVKTSDSTPDVESLDDLLDTKFQGKVVVINVDPTDTGTATRDVVTGAFSNGGSTDNVPPEVDYFRRPEDAGHPLTVDPTPRTAQSDQASPSSSSGTTPTQP